VFIIKRTNNFEIQNYVESLGYILLQTEYIKHNLIITFKDTEGYKYQCHYANFKKNNTSNKFCCANKYTIENIKLFLKQNDIDLILLSKKYFGSDKFLYLKDLEGYLYATYWDNLKQLNYPNKFYKSNPYTIRNIKLWLKINNKNFELLSNHYENNIDNLKWKCLKNGCNEEFDMSWNRIISGCGCPFCVGKRVSLSNCLATKYPDVAKEWNTIKNGDLTPYDVTYGSEQKVWWKCENGHEWEASPNLRTNRLHLCPYCSHFLPSKEYNLLVTNPQLIKEWDYNKNTKNPEEYLPFCSDSVWWICNEGHEWETNIYNRTLGRGCPKCNKSKGEKRIEDILVSCKINYISQYSFNDLYGDCSLLRFDFAIFEDKDKTKLKCLIEYDGEFHYKKQYENDGYENIIRYDQLKNNYCNFNNIILYRIPYWEYDNIDKILLLQILDKEKDLLKHAN
jgi:hypothetical protein